MGENTVPIRIYPRTKDELESMMIEFVAEQRATRGENNKKESINSLMTYARLIDHLMISYKESHIPKNR